MPAEIRVVSVRVDDRERQSGLEHRDARDLPVVQQPFRAAVLIDESGQVVYAAEDESVLAVEIGRAAIETPVELVARSVRQLVDRLRRRE